ncbi:DUF983 domain-containing protein [Methyloceanibacter caenitepidi]|nr:DUF983 domain-containing protein [Methyloceanibacter caenitepidi]
MNEPQSHKVHPPLGATVWAGMCGRCPSCHKGKMFDGYLTLAPACNVCGLNYDFADSGDGPAIFVMLFTGFIIVGAALYVEAVYQPPYWVHALAWGTAALILPLLLLRSFKGVLIALQFRNKAEEGKLVSDR